VQERTNAEQSLRNLSTRPAEAAGRGNAAASRASCTTAPARSWQRWGSALERARRSLQRGDVADAEGVLLENGDLVGQVTQEIRTLSFLLHPPVLDDLGLEYALPWYVKGFSRRSGIAVSVDVPREMGRLPAEVERRSTARSRRRSRTCAITRAAATRASRSSAERDTIRLEIADSGRGFDAGPDAWAAQERWVSASRACGSAHASSAAAMEIESGAGGTTIRVALPLKNHGSAWTAA
jgi:signal transduction histidine kinase